MIKPHKTSYLFLVCALIYALFFSCNKTENKTPANDNFYLNKIQSIATNNKIADIKSKEL